MSLIDLQISEIRVRDFPWQKLPWAEKHWKYNMYNPDSDSCLALLGELEGRIVCYLAYEEDRFFENRLELHYVQTQLEFRGRGYATQLVGKLKRKYEQKAEIWALHTHLVSKGLLTKCGFRLGQQGWIFPKQQKE